MAHHPSHLDLLSQRYPCVMKLTEVAEAIRCKPQTIRNRMVRDEFAIPSTREGRYRLFQLVDVAAYMDKIFGVPAGPGGADRPRKRGRPTKAEQARRQRGSDDGC